jgi:hypothetical protein
MAHSFHFSDIFIHPKIRIGYCLPHDRKTAVLLREHRWSEWECGGKAFAIILPEVLQHTFSQVDAFSGRGDFQIPDSMQFAGHDLES